MNRLRFAATAAAGLLASVALTSVAHATVIDLTLNATYYSVADSATGRDPDFGAATPETPTVGNGLVDVGGVELPVAERVGGSFKISDVYTHAGDDAIEWWDPALDTHVKALAASTQNPSTITIGALGYDNTDMFPSNSHTGTTGHFVYNDTSDFLTAVFSGTFTTTSNGTITFTLASDDDSLVYIDGKLIGSDLGVHGVGAPVTFTTGVLKAGSQTIDIYYADRAQTQAALDLGSFNFTKVLPEPSEWALMLLGVGAVGAAARSRRRRSASLTA